MTPYFEEKSQQVSPLSMEAFGIHVWSRYGKADEIIELLKFAQTAARQNIHTLVKEVFYDSKACICSFEFSSPLEQGTPNAEALLQAALATISQFEWFGIVQHGAYLLLEDEDH